MFTCTLSLMSSILNKFGPMLGDEAINKRYMRPSLTNLRARDEPIKPNPSVMRILFSVKSGFSIMVVSSRLDSFHKKQVRLYHLPIGQRVEVETCPVENLACVCILQLRIIKADSL